MSLCLVTPRAAAAAAAACLGAACVSQLTGLMLRSSLQKILDSKCLEEFATKCQEAPQGDFCRPAVARKVEVASGAPRASGGALEGEAKGAPGGPQWRCYAAASLNFAAASKECTDDCGEPMNCLGTSNSQSEIFLEVPELEVLFENHQPATCIMSVSLPVCFSVVHWSCCCPTV